MKFEFAADVIEGIKTAAVSPDTRDTIPYTAFADDLNKMFPVNTPDNALLSACYAVKQASEISPYVMRRLKTAVELYGLPWPEMINTKVASDATISGDYVFADEQRLLVRSAADVQRADEKIASEMAHVPVDKRREGYAKLASLAAKYSMKISEMSSTALKYAGVASCELGPLMDHIDARLALCAPGSTSESTYNTISAMVTKTAAASHGYYTDPAVLHKLASIIREADRASGLDALYDRQVLDPYLTVYNTTDKLASLGAVPVADKSYTPDQFSSIPIELYQQAFGDDIQAEIAPQGAVDGDKAATIVTTMPRDMQNIFNKLVDTYKAV